MLRVTSKPAPAQVASNETLNASEFHARTYPSLQDHELCDSPSESNHPGIRSAHACQSTGGLHQCSDDTERGQPQVFEGPVLAHCVEERVQQQGNVGLPKLVGQDASCGANWQSVSWPASRPARRSCSLPASRPTSQAVERRCGRRVRSWDLGWEAPLTQMQQSARPATHLGNQHPCLGDKEPVQGGRHGQPHWKRSACDICHCCSNPRHISICGEGKG